MSAVVEARSIGKTYVGGDGSPITILAGLDLAIGAAESVAIVGASGAGKSSLLHLLGALDSPSSGEVWIEGREVAKLSVEARARLRNERIGFVFQFPLARPDAAKLKVPAL